MRCTVSPLLQLARRNERQGYAPNPARQLFYEPLNGFNRQVVDNVNRISGATDGLAQAQERMAAVVGKLTRLVASVLATMLLVVLVGGGLLWHYRSVVTDNQVEADLMRAINQADVSLCEGRLCARVDRADKRFGDYVPIKTR